MRKKTALQRRTLSPMKWYEKEYPPLTQVLEHKDPCDGAAQKGL